MAAGSGVGSVDPNQGAIAPGVNPTLQSSPGPGQGVAFAVPAFTTQEADAEAEEAIRNNNPISQDRYPSTHATEGPHSGATTSSSEPLLLKTIEDLERLTLEARQFTGSSNFADSSMPKNAAKAHVLPWLHRFEGLRLVRQVPNTLNIVANDIDTGHSDCKFLLDYPVNLTVNDGAGIPLPGYSLQGLRDSDGYPLFFAGTRPKNVVSIRGSGALYRIMMTRDLMARFKDFPDQHSIRTWMHMFTLSSESEAIAIIQQRVRTASAGDNHIVLLLKAYLAYFDSIAASGEGVIAQRQPVQSKEHVLNVKNQPGWVSTTIKSGKEIVNVLGGSAGYQEFWAHCCFDKPPVYAAKVEGTGMTTTSFSHYNVPLVACGMLCICDQDAFSPSEEPDFFGQPSLILSYIEMYVQRYGLQEQSNEALQIAMVWPALCLTQAHVSLPRPMHTADWLGGEVESSTLETAGSELLAYSPKTVLACSLASAPVVLSQMRDFLALIISDRDTWEVTARTTKRAVQWLVARLAIPGAGWHLLLSMTLSLSPSFLYLTGLSEEAVPWKSFIDAEAMTKFTSPSHLRLLQAFWTESSAMCMLPWEKTWQPQLSLDGKFLTAEASTIVKLGALGVLNPSEQVSAGPAKHLIHSTLARSGKKTVSVKSSLIMDRLRIISKEGIKILALAQVGLAVEAGADPEDSYDDEDPFEALLMAAPML